MSALAAPPLRAAAERGHRTVSAYALSVGALTAAALVARLALLGRMPLWRDEAFVGVLVRRSWTGMFAAVRADSSPPLAYILTRLVAVLSTAPWALRLVPALAGTAAVPLAAALARRCGGDRAGLLAATAVAVLPAWMLASLDARMYALATTMVLAASLTLWRAAEDPSAGRLATHAVTVALAVNTHYLAVLAVLAQVVAVAVALRPGRGALLRIVVTTVAGVATLLPWLVAAAAQRAHVDAPFWVHPLSLAGVGGVATWFFCGPPVDEGRPWEVLLKTFQGVAVVGGTLAGLAAIRAAVAAPRPRRRAVTYLAAAGLLPLLLLAGVSIGRPLFEARYASVLWGPLAPLLGVGLAALWPALRALVLVAGTGASVALLAVVTRPDTPAVLPALTSAGPAAEVVMGSPADYFLVLYYSPDLTGRTRVVGPPVAWYWGTAAFEPGAVVPAVAGGGGTVLAVGDVGETPPPLPAGYHRVATRCGIGICVTTFQPG